MIDLHCHSNISDGALPPQEVVRQAHAQGCTLLVLCSAPYDEADYLRDFNTFLAYCAA